LSAQKIVKFEKIENFTQKKAFFVTMKITIFKN